jgi:acyl-coenzyme A synthetase/AMP-(fatty) acid ligase
VNAPEHVIVQLAAARLGAIAAPINPQWTAGEARALVELVEPRVLVVGPDTAAAGVRAATGTGVRAVLAAAQGRDAVPAEPDPAFATLDPFASLLDAPPLGDDRAEPDDAVAIWHTSGTTGRPKGAVWAHGAFLNNSRDLVHLYGVRRGMGSLSVFPHAHNGSGVGTLGPLLLHGTVDLLARADTTRMLDTIRQHDIGFLVAAVPVLRLLQARMEQLGVPSLPSLRSIVLGATAASTELLDWIAGIAPNAVVYFAYGGSEGYGTYADTRRRDKLGSVGIPVPLSEIRIVDDDWQPLPPDHEGRVAMRGAGMMASYWRDPERSAAVFRGDWCSWGDVGRLDADGWLWLLGRSDDVINTGGYKVHAAEVEAILADVDGVGGVAVVGREHPVIGAEVLAYVAAEPSAELRSALEDAVTTHLARYKRPAEIVFVADLPTNSLGKVQKAQLRPDAPGAGPRA